jgi:hypothetical protein
MLALLPLPLAANDADASVALGGVQLMREPRISMESERLTISLSKITVEYEFLNESDQDITTEVAFPIPPYEYTERAGGIRAFDDFRLWVDGQELKYETEAKAFLVKTDDQGNKIGKEKDVSAILRSNNIDISTLGHYFSNSKYSTDNKTNSDKVPDFERLSPALKKDVIAQGLVAGDAYSSVPLWQVRKTYYWKQTFPAHKILHVRHEYTPGFGFQGMQSSEFKKVSLSKSPVMGNLSGIRDYYQDDLALLHDSCVDSSLQKAVFIRGSAANKADPSSGGYVETAWVDYILTTANSWKTPIKKFELDIERGQNQGWYDPNWDYTSLCWDGPVTRVGPHHFVATATDFVPKKELKVLFLTMPVARAKTDGTGK